MNLKHYLREISRLILVEGKKESEYSGKGNHS